MSLGAEDESAEWHENGDQRRASADDQLHLLPAARPQGQLCRHRAVAAQPEEAGTSQRDAPLHRVPQEPLRRQ